MVQLMHVKNVMSATPLAIYIEREGETKEHKAPFSLTIYIHHFITFL